MTLFSAFVSSLAIFSTSVTRTSECNKLAASNRDYTPPAPIPVTCSDKIPCPRGSQCMRIVGKEGFCVLFKEARDFP